MTGTDSNTKGVKAVVLLSAFGIHAGGGLVLLKALMEGLGGALKIASLDSRFKLNASLAFPQARIEYVRRSFIARISALSRLVRLTLPGDTLLCFNSLPPLRKPRGHVIVFVQAPHFVGSHQGVRYTRLTSLRHKIERLWFRWGIQNCDEIWVQTPVMQELMRLQHPKATIKVVPLVDAELADRLAMLPIAMQRRKVDDSQFTFFYPADAVGHKNHENLFRAWGLLAEQGRNPKLLLTLRFREIELIKERTQLDSHGLISLVNLGWLSRDDVLNQLSKSSALIFPSRAETFGLPMLEARALGVPILASERDFVRDVCTPVQTFDSESPRSIAMAVLRFMDGDLPLTTGYYSAERFVKELLS